MSNINVIALTVAFALIGCTVAHCQQAKYYESFEEGVPDYYSASRPDSLSISSWHYKHGGQCLRWDWRRGEELVINRGIGDPARVGGFLNKASFALWVYMEQPIADALVFEFREGDSVTGSFRFPLEFTGWRQGRLHYDSFPDGKPTATVDNIRIVAPQTVAQGAVFLDFIKYNTLTYPSVSIIPEKVAQRRLPAPDEERFPRPQRVTEAELAGIRTLLGPDERPGVEEARVNDLCDKVQALGIVRDEHGVRGPGLDGVALGYYVAAPGEHGGKDVRYWPDEHGPDAPDLRTPRNNMVSIANQVASAYRASNDEQQRRRLAEAFLLITDHLHDQGQSLAASNTYSGARADSILYMRDVLAQEGRLQRHLDLVLYESLAGQFFVDGDASVRSNMDFHAYVVGDLLRLCFMQVEPTEQVRWLNAFKAMLERSVLQPTSALKIDGSAYHHRGHYFGYAQGAFGNLPPLIEKLRDTPWRLSAEVHERLRRAMLAQRIYCNQLDLPLSLCGRSPFVASGILPGRLQGLDVLARLGTPDGTQEVDREVAAAYLRLVPEAVNEEPYRSLGIKPERDPKGTFVMPYAGLLCHRRDNWLVTVKGQSKYVWGSERQARRNCYGLFQGLGNLEILAGGDPVSAEASGRPADGSGWNWCRYEGTTVPQYPLADLDKVWNTRGTVWSPESFMGGLSHQGRHGIFAMIVNQAMPGGTTLTGRESWFFNDDHIICLGSDISCDEAQYPTQTTLCQKVIRANEQGQFPPTPLDGADFAVFPEEQNLDEAKPHWFIDVQQTGYWLPARQKVTVARQRQTSRDVNDWEDTEGSFLTAWIDHGTAPSNANYEYMVVVRATPDTLQRFAAQPPYHTVQRDQNAHIIWHTDAGRWGCVFFVPQQVTAHTVGTEALPIKEVDRPCLVMAETVGDGQLDVSVADPDLNLEAGVNQARPLRIALSGLWRLVAARGRINAWDVEPVADEVRIVSSSAEETVLEIVCEHGASYDISLARQ